MTGIARLIAASLLAGALAACGGGEDADALDNRLAAKADADPALTASLEDQIMVDTSLSGQANDKAIRPPREPAQTPVPPDMPQKTVDDATAATGATTLGSLAERQAENYRDAFNGCGLNVDYSARFAAQLPQDLPLYPGARVIEAAGSNDNDCKLRAVSYAAPANVDAVANHYLNAARRAGYAPSVRAEGKGKFVSGRRAADGGAFYVTIQPQGSTATADLVVNNGI